MRRSIGVLEGESQRQCYVLGRGLVGDRVDLRCSGAASDDRQNCHGTRDTAKAVADGNGVWAYIDRPRIGNHIVNIRGIWKIRAIEAPTVTQSRGTGGNHGEGGGATICRGEAFRLTCNQRQTTAGGDLQREGG